MVRKQPYSIIFAPEVEQHLQFIEPKYWSLIRQTVAQQLEFEPLTETRNRKRLRRPSPELGQWEVRFGPDNRFRAFYRVNEARFVVEILALGVKDHERLRIAGKERRE